MAADPNGRTAFPMKFSFLRRPAGAFLLAVAVFPAPAQTIERERLDALGIPVAAAEDRAYSYTDKRDGYFHGRSHRNGFDDHFAGWNVGTRRVMQDYILWIDGAPLDRKAAAVTVYPDRLERRHARALETFRMYDRRPVLGILLEGVQGKRTGISLRGEQIALLAVADGIAYYRSKEAPQRVLAVAPIDAGARLARGGRGKRVLSTAARQGFFIVLADDRQQAGALIAQARREHRNWSDQRSARMAALIGELNPLDGSDAELVRSVHWTRLTLDQLVMEQTGRGIYAGLPWFNDYWGRDMFISLPGAALVNGEFDVARDILRSFARYQNVDPASPEYGRVPNRLRPDDVIYNTTDGTPRFVRALYEYVQYTGDQALARELYPAVERAIEGPMRQWMDGKGYLRHEDADTWMDAKLDGVPWSPRGDRANDIQALWYGQLQAGGYFAALLDKPEQARRWRGTAERMRKHFARDFFDAAHAPLMADRLRKDGSADFSLRPNQLFAAELIDDPLARARLARRVWESLVYPWGVASLSQEDDGFRPYHHADACYHFDSAYHNGTVWLWNNGIAMQRLLEAGQTEPAYALFRNMTRQALHEGAVGGLSENTDALPRPGAERPTLSGAFLQAWSNAEYLRVWQQYFLGVRPDAAQSRLTLAPRLSKELREISFGARLLGGRLQAEFRRTADDGERYVYRFDGIDTRVRFDFPRFAIAEIAVRPGDRIEVERGAERLRVRVYAANGQLRSSRERAPDRKRLQLQARLDAVFTGVGFAVPKLRDDLPALRGCEP